jgi:hypothetical protein
MKSPGSNSVPALWRGVLRAYGLELRGWVGGIGLRYGAAAFLLLCGSASLIAAIGVGVAALFHWLEANYGLNHAYAIVSGLLAVLSLASALTATLLCKRGLPPVPRPGRQTIALGRHMAADTSIAASAAPRTPLIKAPFKVDAPTEVMAALAAVCLVGWVVWSRRSASQTPARAK